MLQSEKYEKCSPTDISSEEERKYSEKLYINQKLCRNLPNEEWRKWYETSVSQHLIFYEENMNNEKEMRYMLLQRK